MADAAVVKYETTNPCCEWWKAKVTKLEEKITGMKARRGLLVDGIRMYEKNLPLVEAENRKLLKENEEERKRADDEREEKLKEMAKRVSLEGEISVLRFEIASLKESGGGGIEDFDEEVVRLRASVVEGEQEINRLRDCLEKEKIREDFSEEVVRLRASVADGEREINRLRDCLEKKKVAEGFGEEVVRLRAYVAEGEKEINRLRDCLEKEKKAGEDSGVEVLRLRASVAEGEQEINRLKGCLQKEKAQAAAELKKAAAERKTVEAELKKTMAGSKKVEVERKKIEAEMKKIKTGLKKAESESKTVEAELKKTCEALITTKEEKDRNEKLQEDNDKEMKVNDSAFQVSLENEISALKSHITPLQQKAEDMEKEVTLLQGRVDERESEINRLNELLQKVEEKADFEKKKYEEERIKVAAEIFRIKKMCVDNEKEEKAKEQAVQVALEDEISDLKSQIVVLQQKAGTDAQDAENNASFLKECVSDKETELNLLKELLDSEKTRADFEKRRADEERKKADEILYKMQEEGKRMAVEELADLEQEEEKKDLGVRLSLENEISALQSQILMLQPNLGVRDMDKEVSVLQECVSAGEAEIRQLKKLLEEERTRADFEKKKFETEQKKVYEAWEIVSAEKVRADEVSKLAAVEQKKAEEVKLELERLSVEAVDLRSTMALEILKLQQTKDALEIERQNTIKEKRRADLEMAKAEEQKKLTEINRRKVEEEKFRADCLSQQLEDGKRRLEKLQETAKYISSTKSVESSNLYVKHMNLETATLQGRPLLEMKNVLHCFKCEEVNQKLKDVTQKANREKKRADSEMRKAEERKKVLEANEQKVLEEKNRADLLAQELQDKRREIEELKKAMQEPLPFRALVDSLASKYINVEERKLLRKKLKLEKLQVKHAKEVVSFEKGRNFLLQQQLSRLKDDFYQVSDHLDMLDKCFSYWDVSKDDLKKNCNDSDSRKLHLKRKVLAEEPYEMHLQSGSELLKHSCTDSDDSDPSKNCVKCNSSLLHISKRNCTESISGIDSKLETLLRSSKRTMLKSSSAINSTTESFSDRQLMGSQERGALSVIELNKLVDGKTNSQPTISGKSDDVTKSIHDKNTAVVAENSVRSPLRIDAVKQKVGHSKKRKRIDNTIVSIKDLICGGKNWHLQTAEKLSTLQAMLKNHTDKCLGEGKHLLPDVQDSDQIVRNVDGEDEVVLQLLHISNAKKDKLGIDSVREIYTRHNDSSPVNNVTRTPVCSGRIDYTSGEDFNFFEQVADEDYLKLLELDSALDEEIYRLAIERPLSPTLPEIGDQMDKLKSSVVGCHSGVLSVQNDNTPRTFHENECVSDFCKILENNEDCKFQTTHARNSSASKLWNLNKLSLFDAGNKGINISLDSYQGSVGGDISFFCVVSSDNNDNSSISKIFSATKTCLTRCSFTSQMDRVVQKTLAALLEVENLLPKEKNCVFLSLLLQKFSWFSLENFKDVRDEGLIHFFDSFSGHMNSDMNNIETRRMFEELLDLDEVLNLIEDFLIDRRVLVHGDVSSQACSAVDSMASIVLSGGNLISFQAASAQQLLSAAAVLASICAAVDNIDFVCEASYNILKMQKIDSSVLTVLHVFAYMSGANYFTNNDYSLLMTVIKSLVTFTENATLSSSSSSYCQTSIKSHLGFSACNECPFSEGVVSMDLVVSLLMEKLGNYALSDITYEDLVDSIVFLNSKSLDSKKLTNPWPGEREICCIKCSNSNASLCLHKPQKSSSPKTNPNTLSYLGDVLSLCELVALNMSWNWTFNNIVLQLLKMLDTCVVEKTLPAIVILIGQLGRLGVGANGYDDNCVEKLRDGLYGFLCRSASSNMGLSIQIATVTSLLGVISLSFEEIINTNIDFPEAVSGSSPNYIGKWFSSLSDEQRSLSLRLLVV